MARESIIVPGASYEFGGGVKQSCVQIWLVKGGTEIGEQTGNLLDGMLAQNVTGAIQKNIRQVYEIGTTKVYMIEGRPQGSGSIQHLVGPSSDSAWKKLSAFADVCETTDLVMKSLGNCMCVVKDGKTNIQGTEQALRFTGGFLNSVQISATSQDYVITSNLGFTFFDLAYEGDATGTGKKADQLDAGD